MEHWVKWVNNQNIFSLCLPETRSWQLLTYIRVNKAIATYFRDPKRKRLLKYWSCNGERGTYHVQACVLGTVPCIDQNPGRFFFISGKISRKIEQNFGTRNRIDITEMQQLLKKYDSDIIAENYFLFCFSNLEGFGSPIIA